LNAGRAPHIEVLAVYVNESRIRIAALKDKLEVAANGVHEQPALSDRNFADNARKYNSACFP
jgi:hypothetical protein